MDTKTSLRQVVGLAMVFSLGLTLSVPRAGAEVYRVDPEATGEPDGESWETAYNTIEEALDRAEYGDQIWVRYATYEPQREYVPGPDPRTRTFLLDNQVEIYGGFLGTADPEGGEEELSARNVYLNETILSGDLGEGVYVYHVVTSDVDAFGTRLDGFTVTQGHAEYSGGGMISRGSATGVIRCTFSENQADGNGGAISVGSIAEGGRAPFRIVNCIFAGNSAEESGGAVSANAAPEIVNSLFYDNVAASATLNYGGAVSNVATITLTNCTLAANHADRGGGVAGHGFYGSETTLANCILWGNSGYQGWLNDRSAMYVRYSDVQNGESGIGGNHDELYWEEGNKQEDPQFLTGMYRPGRCSPCRDEANEADLPLDIFDLDYDGLHLEELIPYDLDLGARITDELPDMGAYEICLADLNDDGEVGTVDLLKLLGCWGQACGDVDGDNDTDTSDLLYLLGTWGCGDPTGPPVPQSIQDCIDQYGFDPEVLEACIEAMILAGTP